MNGSDLRGELYYANLGYGIGSEQEATVRWSSCKTTCKTRTAPP